MKRMKRTHLLLVSAVWMVGAGVTSGAAEEAEPFLADTHGAAGISCSDCHEESPAATAVPGNVCMACHEDYQEATADMYEDPHNAHLAYSDCGDCHHAHKASENQCLSCHPTFGASPDEEDEESPAEEVSPAAEASPATEAAQELFLADAHGAAGISCGDCHEESPAAAAVSGSVCMTCHEDYQDATAEMYEDPHNAHLAYSDCGDCHHAHKADENQCLSCHPTFGMTAS